MLTEVINRHLMSFLLLGRRITLLRFYVFFFFSCTRKKVSSLPFDHSLYRSPGYTYINKDKTQPFFGFVLISL